jgi:hypothetical protein
VRLPEHGQTLTIAYRYSQHHLCRPLKAAVRTRKAVRIRIREVLSLRHSQNTPANVDPARLRPGPESRPQLNAAAQLPVVERWHHKRGDKR